MLLEELRLYGVMAVSVLVLWLLSSDLHRNDLKLMHFHEALQTHMLY